MAKRNFFRMALGSPAKAAAVTILVIVTMAAFTLAYGHFGFRFPAERKETDVIAVDAMIGATVEPLDRVTAESLGVAGRDRGLVVTSLGDNGPAARAGIRPGDVIERIGGTSVSSAYDAAAVLKGAQPPDIILTLNRGGLHAIVRLPIRAPPEEGDMVKQGSKP